MIRARPEGEHECLNHFPFAIRLIVFETLKVQVGKVLRLYPLGKRMPARTFSAKPSSGMLRHRRGQGIAKVVVSGTTEFHCNVRNGYLESRRVSN